MLVASGNYLLSKKERERKKKEKKLCLIYRAPKGKIVVMKRK